MATWGDGEPGQRPAPGVHARPRPPHWWVRLAALLSKMARHM